MDNKVCFLFGHAATPYEAIARIEAAAERHYQEHGIRTFIVGNRGSFDGYAAAAIKSLKQRHSDISLLLLLAYHPGERAVDLTDGFDNSYYPPLENVPRQYAIVRANKYMMETCRRYDYSYGYFNNFVKVIKTSFKIATDFYGFINYKCKE